MAPPAGNSVEVCHAYTCQIKTTFYFRPKDIQDISAEMRKVKRRYAVPGAPRHRLCHRHDREEGRSETRHQGQGWHGIRRHRRSHGTRLRGRGHQHDELHDDPPIAWAPKYHTVVVPMTKGDLLKATLQGDPVKYWPHWTAVIQERAPASDSESIPGSMPTARTLPWSRSRSGTSKTSITSRKPPCSRAIETRMSAMGQKRT